MESEGGNESVKITVLSEAVVTENDNTAMSQCGLENYAVFLLFFSITNDIFFLFFVFLLSFVGEITTYTYVLTYIQFPLQCASLIFP